MDPSVQGPMHGDPNAHGHVGQQFAGRFPHGMLQGHVVPPEFGGKGLNSKIMGNGAVSNDQFMSINRVQAAQDGRVMSQLPGYRNYPHNSIGNQFHTNVGQSGMGNWMGGGAMMVPRLPRSQGPVEWGHSSGVDPYGRQHASWNMPQHGYPTPGYSGEGYPGGSPMNPWQQDASRMSGGLQAPNRPVNNLERFSPHLPHMATPQSTTSGPHPVVAGQMYSQDTDSGMASSYTNQMTSSKDASSSHHIAWPTSSTNTSTASGVLSSPQTAMQGTEEKRDDQPMASAVDKEEDTELVRDLLSDANDNGEESEGLDQAHSSPSLMSPVLRQESSSSVLQQQLTSPQHNPLHNPHHISSPLASGHEMFQDNAGYDRTKSRSLSTSSDADQMAHGGAGPSTMDSPGQHLPVPKRLSSSYSDLNSQSTPKVPQNVSNSEESNQLPKSSPAQDPNLYSDQPPGGPGSVPQQSFGSPSAYHPMQGSTTHLHQTVQTPPPQPPTQPQYPTNVQFPQQPPPTNSNPAWYKDPTREMSPQYLPHHQGYPQAGYPPSAYHRSGPYDADFRQSFGQTAGIPYHPGGLDGISPVGLHHPQHHMHGGSHHSYAAAHAHQMSSSPMPPRSHHYGDAAYIQQQHHAWQQHQHYLQQQRMNYLQQQSSHQQHPGIVRHPPNHSRHPSPPLHHGQQPHVLTAPLSASTSNENLLKAALQKKHDSWGKTNSLSSSAATQPGAPKSPAVRASANGKGQSAEARMPSAQSSSQKSEESLESSSKQTTKQEWEGTVEGTKPNFMRLKKMTAADCGGSLHMQQIWMSLKSGILPESSWAIDIVNILLADDQGARYFTLHHQPTLLNSIVDHFRKCLREIFGASFERNSYYLQPSCESNISLMDFTESPAEDKTDQFQSRVKYVTPKTIALSSNSEDTNYRDPRLIEVPEVKVHDPRGTTEEGPGSADFLGHIDVDYSTRYTNFPTSTVSSTLDQVEAQKERFKGLQRIEEQNPHCMYLRRQARTISESSDEYSRGQHCTDFEDCLSMKKYRCATPDGFIQEEYEVCDEEESVLWKVSPDKEALQQKCLCLANILRSLSFISGNDTELTKHSGLLKVMGGLLMLHHVHTVQLPTSDQTEEDKKVEELKHDYWWWDCLKAIRESVFIILSNISGQLDLSIFPESITLPLLDGLLHWSVCPSTQATDQLSSSAQAFDVSPQRLVLETLAKMSIADSNVDYILATPPLKRLEVLYARLVNFLGYKDQPVIHQLALVLLSNLAQGDETACHLIGQQKMVVTYLIECLESAELMQRRKSQPYNIYDENSSMLSLAMLRRAVVTLLYLSRNPQNRALFISCMDRLLYLSTSECLDASVSTIIMDILFELGKHKNS